MSRLLCIWSEAARRKERKNKRGEKRKDNLNEDVQSKRNLIRGGGKREDGEMQEKREREEEEGDRPLTSLANVP